ncbi:unnamed protein product [Ambrosiozyma monospora]|uniref:Dolichyl-phosphate-mannose--protein mannosyltransferase n=1 Tax=Ambrosiozyma monospora TaxID=43982 RepID=A0A9W6T680_AMBMO|nr:unnamed protein product [Ambrosiozyma monospora]
MWEINSGLTQPHVYESRPESWPLLNRGISYWRSDDHQIYLLGNPVVWWIASFIFLPFGLYIVAQIICWQYGTPLSLDAEIFNYNLTGLEYILGWFLHYYPSFLMARQLFLHHYIPALYFAILALGQTLEFVYTKILKENNVKLLNYYLNGIMIVRFTQMPLAFHLPIMFHLLLKIQDPQSTLMPLFKLKNHNKNNRSQ